CFCFFFQAEDGIRDDLVTGVQTCALPISARCAGSVPSSPSFRASAAAASASSSDRVRLSASGPFRASSSRAARWNSRIAASLARSEERRVGKEGRAGWGRGEDKGEYG